MKKLKFIIVFFILIIILCGAGYVAYLYLKTDFFKSNKELFFRYLGQVNIRDTEYVKRYNELYSKLEESNYSSMRSGIL